MLVVRGDKHHMTATACLRRATSRPARPASGCRETTRQDDVRRVTVTLAHHRQPPRRSAPATVVRVAPPADGAASLRPRRRSPWDWSRVWTGRRRHTHRQLHHPVALRALERRVPPYSPARRSRTRASSASSAQWQHRETQHRHNLIIDPAYPDLDRLGRLAGRLQPPAAPGAGTTSDRSGRAGSRPAASRIAPGARRHVTSRLQGTL